MGNKFDECLSFSWRELITEAKKNPVKTKDDIDRENDRRNVILPDPYPWFFYMDNENHPDMRRFFFKLTELEDEIENTDVFDYLIADELGMRIIIEKNPYYRKYPLIYIKDDNGNIYNIHAIPRGLLINMEIYVLDESIKNPAHVIALLVYYMEYPIRVKRIQKEYAMKALLGMLTKQDECECNE